MTQIEHWMNFTPVPLMGLALLLAMILSAFIGHRLRKWSIRQSGDGEEADAGSQEGYVVSSVLGLLALLLGFTFALAVDRFDSRRVLVLEEANAIGTSYLRAQLLEEPHRSRMSEILRAYTENRVKLGQASFGAEQRHLLQTNDELLTDLWSATAASFDSVRHLDFSSALIDSINSVIDYDTARKTARFARVPVGVFVVLTIYVLVSAGMLGFVLACVRRRVGLGTFLILLSASLLLIIDIDRPTTGWIRESQMPMELLRDNLRKMPPGSYDKWRLGGAESLNLKERRIAPSTNPGGP